MLGMVNDLSQVSNMYMWVVQVKFKLCHMTQVLLRGLQRWKESRVIKVGFLHLQMWRYITN